MTTMALLLRDACADAGSAVAVHSDRHQLSYADTWRQVGQLGGELRAAGLAPGQRVVVVTSVSVESVLILAAVSWTGATMIPTVAAGPRTNLDGLMQFSPCYLIGTIEQIERLRVGSVAGFTMAGEHFLLARWGGHGIGDAQTEDEAIFLTSGTTDGPLGVVCSQAQVSFSRSVIQQRLRYARGDRVLIGGPLVFDYNFYQILLTFAAKGTLVVCDQVNNPLAMAERILRLSVTVLPLIPYSFRLLLQSRLLERGNYSGVRLLSATGEAWPTREIELLMQAFPRADAFPMYGLTECKRVSILDLRSYPELLGSVGFPLPGTRLRILDPDLNELPAGIAGQIAVEGPHVARGYYCRPEATQRRFHQLADGGRLLLTGDQGYLDDRGALWFVGRDADLIKFRGIRISAAEIESAYLQCPDVRRVVAANVVTPHGEKVAVIIELADSSAARSNRVSEALRGLWPLQGQPDHIEFGSIPILANGKPARTRIAALLHERCNGTE